MTTLFPELDAVEVDTAALAEQYDPTPHPYLLDPVGWTRDRLDERMWSKQAEIAESVVLHRYTAAQSAHDTGKSFDASRLTAWWLDVHPPGEAFVVTTAPTAAQVEAILWREISKAHRKGSLPGRILSGTVPMWKMNGEIVAYGRKPADHDQAAFQGIHALYVLIIIDEAGGVPESLYNAVDSLATNKHARVLAIGNPDDPSTHFEKVCRPGSGWNHIKISAFDTPAFTGEDVEEGLLDLLVSPEWVEERKARWGESSPIYISKVLGEFPDVTDDTLISPKLIREAQARDLSGEAINSQGRIGGDIARYGADETVAYLNRAGYTRLLFRAAKQSTTKTTGMFASEMLQRSDQTPAALDAGGVGGGVVDNLLAAGRPVVAIEFGGAALDPERFANRRAEMYWLAREELEQGLIDLDPDDDQLAAQLGSIKFTFDAKGRILIESKKDMKKRGLPSPDRADAFVLSLTRDPKWVEDALGDDWEDDKSDAPLTHDLLGRPM